MDTQTRKKPLSERLVGVKEIAAELGTQTTNVTSWIYRREQNGFPKPLAQLAMGGVYDLDEVQRWAKDHGIFVG